MGFTAEGSVSGLDWSFKPYVDASGVTPEPSSDQIKDYWAGYGALLQDEQERLSDWQERLDAAAKDKDKARKIREEFKQAQRVNADESQNRRIELLAKLCGATADAEGNLTGGCPTIEQIRALPGRVFDAFNESMQEALVPKALKPGTTS